MKVEVPLAEQGEEARLARVRDRRHDVRREDRERLPLRQPLGDLLFGLDGRPNSRRRAANRRARSACGARSRSAGRRQHPVPRSGILRLGPGDANAPVGGLLPAEQVRVLLHGVTVLTRASPRVAGLYPARTSTSQPPPCRILGSSTTPASAAVPASVRALSPPCTITHPTTRQPGFRATIVIASLISRSQSQPEAIASAWRGTAACRMSSMLKVSPGHPRGEPVPGVAGAQGSLRIAPHPRDGRDTQRPARRRSARPGHPTDPRRRSCGGSG